MNERAIFKISIASIIIGLVFLLLYAGEVNLDAAENIEDIPEEQIVKIKGRVTNLKTSDKAIFLEVEGEVIQKNQVLAFTDSDLYLQEGDYVEISGMVEEYNGEKEIIASQIIVK